MRPVTRALNALPTPVAGAIAHRIWRGLGTPESVHERDADVHARAERGQLEVNGSSVVTYRWGAGPRVILLVHGWRSRASRLSALVRALEPHATIVAFDAPGNGDSPGKFATVLDYAEAIHLLGEEHGEFHAIVGHSFGVMASFLAVREGVATRRLVGISGMHDAETGIMHAFARNLGLSPRVAARLRHLVETRTFAVVDDPWARFTTRIDDARVPVLLVYDELDRTVLPVAADLIAAAHPGPVEVLRTSGLGHSRILSDPEVVGAIEGFVRAPVAARV